MTGVTIRQETEFSMVGGGLKISVVLDEIWAVEAIAIFIVGKVSVSVRKLVKIKSGGLR